MKHRQEMGVSTVNAISFNEMGSLNSAELAERMDLVLKTARSERMHPYYNEDFDLDPYVIQFFRTKSFQELPPEKVKSAVWKTFDLIVQMEYVRSYSGFQNSLPLPQHEAQPWESPRHMIPFLAQEQAAIVGARIVLERFMDLIHYLATGNELTGRSKFGAFEDWLFDLPVISNWFYLLPQLPWLRKHDKNFRSAEVHDGSKLKKYLVTLQNIPSELQNEALDLTNLLANLWRNVLPILEGKKATSIGGIKHHHNIEWMKSYTENSVDDLEVLKKSVKAELQALA